MTFASSGFGSGPFGAFGPEEPATPASPTKAKFALAPVIVDGDTVLDADGNLVDAGDPIDEEVAFYIITRTGSFFGDGTIGNSVYTVLLLTKQSIVTIRDLVVRALEPMVLRGDIADVEVEPKPIVRNGLALNYYEVTYRKTGLVRT